MKLRMILSGLILLACAVSGRADSPLTSTHFDQCYSDVAMVAQAAKYKGKELPVEILLYLADASQPVDRRAAVVNAAGWNFDGLPNGDNLLALFAERGYTDLQDLCDRLDPGTLVILAYTIAMSDYFNVEEAMAMAQRAVTRNRHLYMSIEMIAAMIRCQYYLDHDIARVGRTAREVLADPVLKHDMRQPAIDAIMEYIDLY